MRSFLTSVVSLFTFTFVSQLSSVEAFAQCYYPDGSIPTDWIWEPCTGAQYSSCCVPSEGDICQPDGLCYYPQDDLTYRGTCTDRTWQDPSCNADICVNGFETTWNWAIQCDNPNGSDTWACGTVDPDGTHEPPDNITCPSPDSAQTAFVTTQTTTSVGLYTPPPTVNTKIYSVYTSQYTATLTADELSTTLTTTYASTFTSKIDAVAATSGTNIPIAISTNTSSSDGKGGVTLSIGALVGIIILVIVLLTLGLGTAVIIRNKRLKKKEDAIRLNSAVEQPPPNGPVGRDQVYPYEVAANEVHGGKYGDYSGAKVEAYEIGDQGVYGGGGEKGEVRSPAPAYSVAAMPVELDGSPGVYASSRGEGRPYGRY
ncbi:hypothetical protein L207DRAFT_640821 [Hyaloscypha variabilis F]|uniref:Mid2 domain-containing protein n=1 Tax=Hyaloscypha variabilis (strain UAMH 11265 / GT02V1 / F) TaxID=1149755 RepID=A0A2J6QZ70_HYAVF|nr:hypothetical protein L207DRAFT_640821 [Hyaloscypha variabilis F]